MGAFSLFLSVALLRSALSACPSPCCPFRLPWVLSLPFVSCGPAPPCGALVSVSAGHNPPSPCPPPPSRALVGPVDDASSCSALSRLCFPCMCYLLYIYICIYIVMMMTGTTHSSREVFLALPHAVCSSDSRFSSCLSTDACSCCGCCCRCCCVDCCLYERVRVYVPVSVCVRCRVHDIG